MGIQRLVLCNWNSNPLYHCCYMLYFRFRAKAVVSYMEHRLYPMKFSKFPFFIMISPFPTHLDFPSVCISFTTQLLLQNMKLYSSSLQIHIIINSWYFVFPLCTIYYLSNQVSDISLGISSRYALIMTFAQLHVNHSNNFQCLCYFRSHWLPPDWTLGNTL